jgi:hypothetical protein
MVAWQVAFGLIPAFDDLLDYDLMSTSFFFLGIRTVSNVVFEVMDTRGTFASNALNASDAGIAAIVNILGPLSVVPNLWFSKLLTSLPPQSQESERV